MDMHGSNNNLEEIDKNKVRAIIEMDGVKEIVTKKDYELEKEIRMEDIESLVEEVLQIEETASTKTLPNRLTESEQEEMAEKNLKLVHLAARNYSNKNVSHDEFFSVALLGYTKALQNYDRDKSNFSTFAMKCMTNEMNQFLRKERKNQDNTVSSSVPLYENGEGGVFTMADSLSGEDYGQPSCDDIVLLNQDVSILLESINKLTEKEQFIIKNRFGVGGGTILTQSEVADHLVTSQANISKMESMILGKLKKHMRGRMNLTEFEMNENDEDDENK